MRGRVTPPPKPLSTRAQLGSGPVCPRRRAETLEGRQRRVQLFAGCARPTAAPQSLAVGELCSGTLPLAWLTGLKLERGREGFVAIGDSLFGMEAYPGREGQLDLVLWSERIRAVIAGDTLINLGNGLEIPARWLPEGVTFEHVATALSPLLEKPVEI